MEKIHIALASNSRYMPGLLVTMTSIIRSASKRENLRFYIFSDGLTEDEKTSIIEQAHKYGVFSIQFIVPDISFIKDKIKAYNNSYTAYLRLFYCQMLNLDWVIYSDVDTIWCRDVEELWNLRNNAYSLGWCLDLPSIRKAVGEYHKKWNNAFDESRYCCSGVILMNLKRLRETHFIQKCISFIEEYGTPFFADQDILNYICQNDSLILPQYWDSMNPTREAVSGLVYHFNGIGKMFHTGFQGWRPLYYKWFRYYYDVILEDPKRPVCGMFKRFLFYISGTFYPNRTLISFLTGHNLELTDNICRQCFFAWINRRMR